MAPHYEFTLRQSILFRFRPLSPINGSLQLCVAGQGAVVGIAGSQEGPKSSLFGYHKGEVGVSAAEEIKVDEGDHGRSQARSAGGGGRGGGGARPRLRGMQRRWEGIRKPGM